MNLNDAIRSIVGSSGNLNDGLRAHYLANGASSGALNDLERQFLSSIVSSTGKSTQDMWREALETLSLSGSLGDQLVEFWSTYGGVFSYELNATFNDYAAAILDATLMSNGALNDGDADANGIGVNNTSNVTWVTVTDVVDATLKIQGSIYLEMNADRIPIGKGVDGSETAPVATGNPANLVSYGSSSGTFVLGSSNEIRTSLLLATKNADANYRHVMMKIYGQNGGSFIPIIVRWSSTGKLQTVVEDLVVAETQIPQPYDWGTGTFPTFLMADPARAAPDDDMTRNFAITGSYQDLGSQRLNVGFAGDSLMNFGGFPDWMWDTNPGQRPEWVPLENSFATAGPKGIDGADGAAVESTNGRNSDRGCLSTIIRQLSKLGYQTANNYNFTSGGATTAQIRVHIQNMYTIRVPRVLFLNAGTNDVNDGAGFDAAALTAFEANVKAIIDDARSAGVKQIVMSNLHTLANNSSFVDTVYEDNVNDANTAITAAKTYSDGLYGSSFFLVSDAFTAFGGHTPTVSLFRTNDVHHSTAGSELFGRLMGQMVTYT